MPDALLSWSSQSLSDHGIPCVPPSSSITERYGKWERAGRVHSLETTGPPRIYLYPLSFVGLRLQDTVEVTSTFDRTLRILTPKPQAYMVSLIRLLLEYPIGDGIRLRVQDDLVGFVAYYILHGSPLNTKEHGDNEYEEDESEEDFQNRVEEAVAHMKGWDWDTTEEKYLILAERIVRDCRSIWQLSNH